MYPSHWQTLIARASRVSTWATPPRCVRSKARTSRSRSSRTMARQITSSGRNRSELRMTSWGMTVGSMGFSTASLGGLQPEADQGVDQVRDAGLHPVQQEELRQHAQQ